MMRRVQRAVWLPRGGASSPLLVFLAVIVGTSYLGLGFIMPLRALYGRSVGASPVEIGLMASSFLLAGFFAAPLMGRLTDRYGPTTVLWVGLLAHGFLVLAYIPARDAWLLIALRAVEGVAASAVLPPARALVNALAPANRQGESLGLLSAAQSSGILLGPAVGSFLASATTYDTAFVVACLPLFAGALAARVFLPRMDGHTSARDGVPEPVARGVVYSRPLTLTYSLQMLLGFSGGAGMACWTLYMADRHSSLFLIGLSYTTYALPGIFLTPLFGRFSDRIGRYWPIAAGLPLFGAVFALYILPLTPWAIVLISTLEGIPAGLVGSAVSGLLADVTPPRARGRVQANFSAAGTLGSLISSTYAGALYAISAGLPFFAVGVLFIASGLALFAPPLARLFPERHVAGGSREGQAVLATYESAEERAAVPHA
jgi:MFS family permease